SWLSPYSPMNHPDYNVHFVYHDPKWDELTSQQKNYIRTYVTSFEENLYGPNFDNPATGYEKYIDVESFIDYFIVNEISRNNDGFKKSRYFNKDKNGKIKAGPVWDFDWAWKNINECYIFKATDGSGWSYKVNNCNPGVKSPGWMIRLFYDDDFKNQTNCRYFEKRATVLSNERIFAMVDSMHQLVEKAQERHFQKWDILGKNVGAPEIGEQPLTYEGEIEKLKNWITTRLNWLDNNMVGSCPSTTSHEWAENSGYKIYPNPATSQLSIQAANPVSGLQVYNLSGKLVLSKNALNAQVIHINVSQFDAGMYLLKLVDNNGQAATEKIVIQ
ncbi:MAG: CotH kinase family protein, partial [Bacteroidota bacterium]